MSEERREFYGRPYYVNPLSNWRHAYWDFFRINLTVGKMGRVIGDTWKLYIQCTAKYFEQRKPKGKTELFISYAFKSKWFVVEREYEEHPNHFLPSHYAVISPDLIALKLGDLEKYFVNVQRNIGKFPFSNSLPSLSFSNVLQRLGVMAISNSYLVKVSPLYSI